MYQVETESGYLVIERIGGLDVYQEDCLVCEINGKCLADYTYNEKIDCEKLDDAIEEELSTDAVMERINDPYYY